MLGIGLFIVLAGGLVALRLQAFDLPVACFIDSFLPGCLPRAQALADYQALAQSLTGLAFPAIAAAPVVIGLLAGISLVGREIDAGTTVFAWSLGPSRRRWLWMRLLPTALTAVCVGLALGLLGNVVLQLSQPGLDPDRSYDLIGNRGLAIAGETLSAMGLALLVGAYFGRVLPGLLLAAAAVICASVVIGLASDKALYGEAMLVGTERGDLGHVVDGFIQTPTGELLSYAEANNRYPSTDDWLGTNHLRELVLINPWATYPVAAARIGLLHLLLGLAAITASFAVVERRRP